MMMTSLTSVSVAAAAEIADDYCSLEAIFWNNLQARVSYTGWSFWDGHDIIHHPCWPSFVAHVRNAQIVDNMFVILGGPACGKHTTKAKNLLRASGRKKALGLILASGGIV